MAQLNDGDELSAAWRALDRRTDGRGWKLIELTSSDGCSMMAGRRGPGNEESLLIGIPEVSIGKDTQLPRGQGFAVVHTELMGELGELAWIAIIRRQDGQLPLFTQMSADIVSMLRNVGAEPGVKVYSRLIARIKAWQRFMSREQSHILSAEEEVGLFGELVVLRDMIASGFSRSDAVEAWSGPDHGLRDFVIGSGGVEAKTTVAPHGFIAEIGSLEQLDTSLHQPLYIGAVRLQILTGGTTLPKYVDSLFEVLGAGAASELFETKLGSAGYLAAMRDHYTRAFVVSELTYRLVAQESPRLTRGRVPAQILDARYTLDLDAFAIAASTFADISDTFGTVI